MNLITTRQAADLARRAPATINRWVSEGRLTPAQKLPGLRGAHLFRPEDVLAAAATPEPESAERAS